MGKMCLLFFMMKIERNGRKIENGFEIEFHGNEEIKLKFQARVDVFFIFIF